MPETDSDSRATSAPVGGSMASPPLAFGATGGETGSETPAYRVVARRYRPQRFDELVGQEHVARGLSGAIEAGRIGHAYLFTGARGVGKTSAARIYAKALQCVAGPAREPCNACSSCGEISAGHDVDVVEIDAASNRGIDEIRQLRQNVAVRPAHGRFKIYIIDEVHMLTREAFNALLKTLEEPPTHVKFVLCTTEPEKLPITILSRCQRFDFVTVDASAIARRLTQIVEAEGATVDPQAVDLIARRAAGSMRDSQSLLEQLLGCTGGAIRVEDVHAIIGTGCEEKVGRLIAAIVARDGREAIQAFDSALEGGADPGGVLEQVIAALRDSLLASVGCGAEGMLQGSGLGIDLPAIGRHVGTNTLLAMLQIIDQALVRMRTSGHAAVLAEMAIVRLAHLDDLETLSEAVEKVVMALPEPNSREKKTAVVTPIPRPSPVAPAVRTPAATAVAPPAERSPPATAEPIVSTLQEALAAVPMSELPSDAMAVWQRTVASVGGLAADYAAHASRAAWRGDVLEVVLPSEATTALSFLKRPEVAAGLSRTLADVAGRPLRHVLIIDPSAPAAPSPVSESNGRLETKHSQKPLSQTAMLRDAMEHPLVRHAQGLFDAAIRKVEPARPREGVVQAATVSGPQSTLHQESLSNAAETCLDDTEVSADEQCIENGIAGNALGDTDA